MRNRVGFILGVLLILVAATGAEAQYESPIDTSYSVASLMFVAGVSLDYLTTIGNDRGGEINPVGKFVLEHCGDEGLLVAGAFYVVSTLLISKALTKRHPRFARGMLQVLGAIHFQAGTVNIVAYHTWLTRKR